MRWKYSITVARPFHNNLNVAMKHNWPLDGWHIKRWEKLAETYILS